MWRIWSAPASAGFVPFTGEVWLLYLNDRRISPKSAAVCRTKSLSRRISRALRRITLKSLTAPAGPAGICTRLWPYIRLARASIRRRRRILATRPVAGRACQRGATNILIAGSQDTGLLALIARACGASDPDIVILNRCPLPLESCRRLARSWSLPIGTMHEDLMNLDTCDRFDMILVHDTLQYIPIDRRVDVLARLRQALASGWATGTAHKHELSYNRRSRGRGTQWLRGLGD